jgi:hypothetical protein
MFSLDVETADLIAAKMLRETLVASPMDHSLTTEATATALWRAGRIPEAVVRYLLLHGDRFQMIPASRFIEACWYSESAGVRCVTQDR